jgi:DNA-binding transcriptional MerR regulator
MDATYSIKDAAGLTGASRQVIRFYTSTYPRWFSTEATPEPGKERRFTAADLKLIRYIYSTVAKEKLTHEQVQARLTAGALNDFEWDIPQEAPGVMQEPTEDIGTALVPVAQLQAARLLLEDAQRREQEAIEQATAMRQAALQREQELQNRINQLERELGKTEGELSAYKTMQANRPKSWWARVLGRGN